MDKVALGDGHGGRMRVVEDSECAIMWAQSASTSYGGGQRVNVYNDFTTSLFLLLCYRSTTLTTRLMLTSTVLLALNSFKLLKVPDKTKVKSTIIKTIEGKKLT